MTRWARLSTWGLVFILSAGVGVLLVQQGLSNAALWATVLGLPIAFVGAVAGVWSLMLAARTLRESRSQASTTSPRPKRGDLELVEAALDPGIVVSAGEEERAERTSLGALVISDVAATYGALDFRFVNRGDATAVLRGFVLELVNVALDVTPVLTYSYVPPSSDAARDVLKVKIENDGWGDALNVSIRLTNAVLADALPEVKRCFTCPAVGNNGGFSFDVAFADLDQSRLASLRRRRAAVVARTVSAMEAVDPEIVMDNDVRQLLSRHEQWHVEEFFRDYDSDGLGPRQRWHCDYVAGLSGESLPTRLEMEVAYCDTRQDAHVERAVALTWMDRSMHEGDLWIRTTRFDYDAHEVSFLAAPPRDIYAVILDPEGPRERTYSISRIVAPGDAERFHILLASTQSGTFDVQLNFLVDRASRVTSEPISVTLTRRRNEALPQRLVDGAAFEIHDGSLDLGGAARRPFIDP